MRTFDGTNGKPIYIALKRQIYDVSEGYAFYGQGKSYSAFAGREASRAIAKMSFEEVELSNMCIDDLNGKELQYLESWIDKFRNKDYPVVGKVLLPKME